MSSEEQLIAAVRDNDAPGVQQALTAGASANALFTVKAFKMPALVMATGRNSPAMVRLLIDHGADVNGRDSHGTSSLVMAAQEGFVEIVEILLASRARMPRSIGHCAVFYASEFFAINPKADNEQRAQVIGTTVRLLQILLKHGADANARIDGQSLLSFARREQISEVVNVLIDHGARIEE